MSSAVCSSSVPMNLVWRGAFSLNNAAVTSASRGSFHDAKLLFRESMNLLRLACGQQQPLQANIEEVVHARIQGAMRYVTQRSYDQHLMCPGLLPIVEIVYVSTGIPVNCLLSSKKSRETESFQLIHIEDCCSTCSKDLEAQAGLVLYNSALVHLIECNLAGATASQSNHLQKSLALLQASFAILERRPSCTAGIPDTLVYIQSLVLLKLAFVLQALGHPLEAAQAAQAFWMLHSEFATISRILQQEHLPAAAA